MPHTEASFALSAPAGVQSPSTHDAACAAAPHHPEGAPGGNQSSTDRVGRRLRRGVADTSREAFHSLPVAEYLAPKELAILALFTGPQVRLSRQQIAQAVPMLINGVCGRVDSLLAAGHLEESGERRRDPATGKSQKLLQLPRDRQASLEGVAP